MVHLAERGCASSPPHLLGTTSLAPGRYLPCNRPWRECRKRLSTPSHLPRHRERGQYSESDALRSALRAHSSSGATMRQRGNEKGLAVSLALLTIIDPSMRSMAHPRDVEMPLTRYARTPREIG